TATGVAQVRQSLELPWTELGPERITLLRDALMAQSMNNAPFTICDGTTAEDAPKGLACGDTIGPPPNDPHKPPLVNPLPPKPPLRLPGESELDYAKRVLGDPLTSPCPANVVQFLGKTCGKATFYDTGVQAGMWMKDGDEFP